jgi:endoglycosylceramidase
MFPVERLAVRERVHHVLAHHRSNKGRRGQAPRGGRVVGLGAAAGMVLSLGTTPLAAGPSARADVLDAVIDQILAPVIDAATNTVNPATWDAAFASILGDVADSGSAAQPAFSAADLTAIVAQSLYIPLHSDIENWINSSVGQQVDGLINTVLDSYAIGNGTAGTASDPAGGAGGWLFGDGGPGWNSTETGVAGGAGGAAGLFGTGGAGGDGGAGAAGGAGGSGGWLMGIGGAGGNGGADAAGGAGGAGGQGGDAAGWLFGVGGNGGNGGEGSATAIGGDGGDGGNGAALLGSGGAGGNAGDGGSSGELPALGGAGGNAGLFGTHGAVGDFGTLSGIAPGGSATGADTVLPISTTGPWLTNSAGQVVIMHGLNEVYKLAPYEPAASGFGNADAAFLAENGFNVVRLGVLWAGVEPEPGVFNAAYVASIEQTVQTLEDHGIYVILDFHQDAYSSVFGGEGAPAWAVQTGGLPNPELPFPLNDFVNPAGNHAWDAFWSNATAPNGAGLENDYAQMVEYVAADFKGNSDVLGVELMNEPGVGNQLLPGLLGSPFFDAQQLTPFYNQVASAVEAVDPTTTVFYEPSLLFDVGVPTHLGTVDFPQTVFSFHDYCDFDLPILGCVPSVPGILDNALAYAQAQGIPAFMTEFGATSDQAEIIAPMQLANQHLINWAEWAFSGKGDITTTASPPSSESLVYNPELPPTGANVNTATLDTLAEPYPQVVSGTPHTWSFDNGTFAFGYSTAKVDGLGSFPAGSQTTISVPQVEFPNGYQVSVTGGQVVSAPDAPELVIASDGANTVSVTVSPAAPG